MTGDGDPYYNPVAERVNGMLKEDLSCITPLMIYKYVQKAE